MGEQQRQRRHQPAAQAASSGLYKPCLNDDPRGLSLDNSAPRAGEDLMNIDQCQNLRNSESQLVGAQAGVSVAASADAAEMRGDGRVPTEAKVPESIPGKRRRGRPPKGQEKTAPAPPKVKQAEEEEDVCFICFDGGSLVLCDRRGCPKAYHPACIKRDEAFFQSKAKWNCGWHICSGCQKASHYMCYTCTYSSCKGCIKDADYVGIRGNKGLCGICLRTIMLIENNVPGDPGAVQVDFDDKTSWEYLFKVYWVYLKEKLALTLDELTRAKNPWKELGNVPFSGGSSGEFYGGNIDKHSSSVNSYLDLEGNNSKRRRIKKQPTHLNNDCLSMQRLGSNKEIPQPEGKKWATKVLLEFVAHMKNGDTSVLSQFDVQALLIEYIRRNDLRDPQKKCEIICDSRLLNLFGKERVGHIEMLKLLEFHFLMKENAQTNDLIQGVVLDACSGHVRADGISDNQPMVTSGKKRKARKKADEGGTNPNLDEYAAIDVHNINLIFLRRSLMESLIDDTDKFHDKVVGSIVRIRISNSDQMQDMYRLVQVVGTSKAAEPYKVGTKTADVMLEILNLDKKEVVSIDGISNQEFSEEECKRLRQYIKCGLIKRLTVGEIQEKAMKLQAVRVNDWLEAEILRLSHLRDRASEKGRRKELRECVEKLQLLSTSEERQRKLLEIPNVHADPNMDPNHDSEEDRELEWKKSGNHVRPESFSFGRGEGESIPPLNTCMPSYVDKENANSWNQRSGAFRLNSWSTSNNQVHPTGSTAGGLNNLAGTRCESKCGVASEISSTGTVQSASNIETDKLWNYKDPTGKIQGPFCLVQLRKWSITGHFPSDLRIWRVNRNQNDSVLLTDALDGRYEAEKPQPSNNFILSKEVKAAPIFSDHMDGGCNKGINATEENNKKEESWNTKKNDESALSNGKEESERSKDSGSHSCSSTPPLDVINSDEEKAASVLLGWDSLKGINSWSAHPQVSSSLPSSSVSGKPSEDCLDQARERPVSEGLNSSHDNGNCDSHEIVNSHADSGHSHDKQSNSESNSGQSSAEDCRPPTVNSYSNGVDSNSGAISIPKSNETSEHNRETSLLELFGPIERTDDDSEGQLAEIKQPATTDVPPQESGPSWSTGSSLVVGGPQLPEVAEEFSPPTKPSVEEWDSKVVPPSSVKPTEVVSDQAATPTSMSELTLSSAAHPIPNTFSWQVLVDGPEEFSPLVDESVSDLLAEVEAMESLRGLSSPTSIMNCNGELVQDSKNDCFDPSEGFSPVRDLGKSARDLFTVKDEPQVISETEVSPQKRSIEPASAKVDTRSTEISGNNWAAGTNVRPSASSIGTFVMAAPDMTWRLGHETSGTTGSTKPIDVSASQWEASPVSSVGTLSMATASTKPNDVSVSQWPPLSSSSVSLPMTAAETNWRETSAAPSWASKPGHSHLGWAGLTQLNTNMDWAATPTAAGHGTGTVQHHTSVNWSTNTGNQGFWGNQLRLSGERYSSSPRDRHYQGGGDAGYSNDRSRPSSNRHSSGGGNAGGSYRSPRGQRVCKFYESGYCKKGASCSYLHP